MKDYKKILEGVANIINNAEKSSIGFADICTYIGENCPELKESEDERVKREIIEYVKTWAYRKDWLAWLEKQGEKVEPKFHEGDVMRTLQEAKDNITSGLPVVISIDKEYYHCTNELIAIKDQDDYEYPPMNRRQNPAWNEEDSLQLNEAIEAVYESSYSSKRKDAVIDWLESIKDRVQPQSKQWSEEDERMVEHILADIQYCKKAYDNYSFHDTEIAWLRSLKDRHTWKPSDEHHELEEFAKIVRGNLTGISKAVQELFEAKYLQLTGKKMYGGFKD